MNYPFHCHQIHSDEFLRLRAGAKVLEMDSRGEKVLLTPDNHIIKLFYPRRRFSSAAIYPYAFRFWRNSQRLATKGIPTVECSRPLYDIAHKRHVICYPLVSGSTLRDSLADNPENDRYLGTLAEFLATIHQKGVLFRSIHMGNILVLDNDALGLIDIADMSIQNRPLSMFKRARNFRHLLHDKRDRDKLRQHGYQQFLRQYEQMSNIHGKKQQLFRLMLRFYTSEFCENPDRQHTHGEHT